jgi:hypothetical protein
MEDTRGSLNRDVDQQSAPSGTPRPSRLIASAAALIVLAVVFGAGFFVLARSGDGPSYAAPQVGWMEQGCQQWFADSQDNSGPDRNWCTSMARWMNQHEGRDLSGGRGSGSVMRPMWHDAATMRTNCERWMTSADEDLPGGPGTPGWCGQMVDWMVRHMGPWHAWMSDGPLEGELTDS